MNTDKIIEITHPCPPGKHYLRRYKTLRGAWYSCPRGDWMLWLAQKLGVDVRVLTLAKGLCANAVRHLMKDPRSVVAVDAAIAFGRGEMGEKELDAAAVDADAAAAGAVDRASYAARKRVWAKTADICRDILTEAVMRVSLEAAGKGDK